MKKVDISLNNEKERRVVHLTSSVVSGGLERRLELIEAESDKGFTNYYIDFGTSAILDTKLPRKKLLHKNFNRPLRITSIVRAIGFVYSVSRRIQPEVLHAHGVLPMFVGVPIAQILGVRVRICEFIGDAPQSLLGRFLLRVVLVMGTRVVALSPVAAVRLTNKIPFFPKKKIRIVANPVALRCVPSARRVSDTVTNIGCVARLERVKNLEALIRGFSHAFDRDENARLFLVGSGVERERLEFVAYELGLREVRFLGHSNFPELHVAEFDLYVQSSLSESFGIAAVEAMLLGIPVMVTRGVGMSYLIKDGVNGYIVDGYSSEDFKVKLDTIKKGGKAAAKQVGLMGQATAREEFSVRRHVRELALIYAGLCRD